MNSVKFTNNNLYDRNERGKINNEYSCCEEIIFGVPQESLDLYSSIFSLMTFLLILDNIEKLRAMLIITYSIALTVVLKKLFHALKEQGIISLDSLVTMKQKLKCHLHSTKEKLKANISNYIITNGDNEKLLGTNRQPTYQYLKHIKNLCSKTTQKLYALSRVLSCMNFNQRRLIMKLFMSQFGYCLLVWM